jgi:hypothetical protein
MLLMDEMAFRADAGNSVAIREGVVLKNSAMVSPNPEL